MKTLMSPARVTSIVMFIVSATCVAVQYNDPDGWVWMLIYSYAVGVSLLAVTGRYGMWAFAGALVYMLMSIWWMPWDQVNDKLFGMPQWHMGPDSNEEAREAGGLFIMALWLFTVSWWWVKGRKKAA